jgi:uncharacterized protein YdeI (YjbR/CyaY-like superfamily)
MVTLIFIARAEFRAWLSQNALSDEGIWVVFGKDKSVPTLTAAEALEEALCFGWIDGKMQSIDDSSYMKYFKQRSKNSVWSEKNKGLTDKLEANKLMTDFGRAKIREAKENGQWSAAKAEPLTEDAIETFIELLRPHAFAFDNYKKMSKSVQKTYALSYVATKTESGREKRLQTILERLLLNLNPMERMPQ